MDVEAKLEDRQWQNAFQDSILDYISVREEERHSIIFRDQKEDSSMKISDARLRFRGLNFVHPPSGVTLFNLAVSGSQFNLEGNTLVIEDSSFTSQMPKQMIQQKAHANEQVHTTTPLLILQCGRATLNSIKVSHFSATESLIYVTENDLNPNLKCSFYCINCLFEDITGCEKANAERANQISEASVMAINYFENIYISNTNFSNCVSGKSEFGGAIKLIGHETYQVCFNSCHVERCKALVSTSHLSNKGKNQASLLLADGHNTIDNEILSTDGKGKGGWMYVQFKPLYPSKLLLTLSQLIFNENDADVGCDIFMLVSNSMFSMSSNIFVDTLNSHIKADNSIIAQSTQDPDKLINLYSQLVPVQLDELHVSSNGEDSIKCGHANLPCYTFSFAVSRGNSRYTYAPEYSMINIILHNNVLIEDPMTVDGISIESEDGTMQQISVKKSEGIDSFWLTTYGKTTFTSLQFIHFSAMKNSNMLLSVMSGTLSINTCNFTQNRIGKLAFDVPLAVINDASIMINDSFIYNIASAANLFVINTSPVNEFQPGQSHMSTIFTNTTFTQIQLTGSSIISLRPYVLSSVLPHSFEVALKGSRVELCKALKAGSPLLANIPEWDVDSPTLTLELTNITHCESPKQAGALVFAERSIVNINSCSFNEITEYKQQNTNIFQAYFFDEPQVACDWSFSSVYLRQCQTSIRYFSYSNVQIGPVAIAGGVLEGTDVSFSRNTLPEIARMYPSVQHNIACFRNRDGELPNAADETKDRGLLKVSALTVDGIDVVAQQKSAWIFNDGCQLGGALSNEIQTNFIPALESVKPFIDSSAFSSSARQTQESSSSLSSTAFQHSSFHSITSALRYAKHFFAQVLSTFTSSPSLQSIDAEEENNITLIFYGQNLIPCNIRYVMMSSKNGQLCNPLNFRSYINENQSVASVPSSWLVPSAINDVISASVVLVSLNDSSIVTFSTANVPVSSSNPTPNNKPKITPNQILAIAASCSAVAFIGLIVLLYIFLRRWSKKNALKTAYATEEMYNKENDHKSYSTFKDNYTGCDNSVSTNSSYLSISSQSYGNSSHSFASDTVIFSAQNRFISSYAKKKHKNKFRSRFSDKSSEEDEEVLYNLSVTIPYDVITPCYEE
ncbi:uncharacterized protein MONOS_10142 [Monocercomonoides exilis]|uniref:uncharacterized protein n=1 Tax=Monocercomonoides exilis TaxID=2049356 RepID=UPI003559DF59|nr:hypothetical protein MONOS_10142 [Monocercomonoides exilis]|eukprot:MONOS_10142.1-p1 / transcript=MONOS_10142.1 / gene=MONOS_10142 / organism=Monocercomonoides_exilis_PA203 / gene_product=unspecified product / transcript_product=unspecified product / location=Mono_scaffold00448:34703-38095(-) / protein_length=1131 / sequence_SO=supercontig / SO=protein_coding / is_pseudo=false